MKMFQLVIFSLGPLRTKAQYIFMQLRHAVVEQRYDSFFRPSLFRKIKMLLRSVYFKLFDLILAAR